MVQERLLGKDKEVKLKQPFADLVFTFLSKIHPTFQNSEILYELDMMVVHELHLLHHHGQVPHVHIQPHVQQQVLLSQHARQVEQ